MDPPLGREAAWIAAEPGLQKMRKGKESAGGEGEREDYGQGASKMGKDLGGVKTTPVRSLEAGAFRMEVWVEEGRGKFQARVDEGEMDGD